MKPLQSLAALFGGAALTVWTLLGLVLVLGAGYFTFEAHPLVFEPLNRLLLWDWIVTYGWSDLGATWWFFAFLLLLALLVTNTAVCTWQKVAALAMSGGQGHGLDWWLRFSPHVMHAAFIVILASHLVTYVFGLNVQNNVIWPGKRVGVPGADWRIELESISSEFYDGQRLAFYRGRAIDQDIVLKIIEPDGRIIRESLAYNSPVWHDGYSIHLKNYYPKAKKSMPRQPYANLIIRRDPGVITFFFGTALFAVGLLAYLWQALRRHQRRGVREA